MVQARRDREDGKVPEEESARRALEKATLALADVNRQRRAALIVKHLVNPLARLDDRFLTEICSEIE